jgi:hypothetical protein
MRRAPSPTSTLLGSGGGHKGRRLHHGVRDGPTTLVLLFAAAVPPALAAAAQCRHSVRRHQRVHGPAQLTAHHRGTRRKICAKLQAPRKRTTPATPRPPQSQPPHPTHNASPPWRHILKKTKSIGFFDKTKTYGRSMREDNRDAKPIDLRAVRYCFHPTVLNWSPNSLV